MARPSPEGGQRALDEQGVFPGEHHLFTELRRRSNDTKNDLRGCVGLSISLSRAKALTFTFVRTDALPGVLDAMQYLDDGPCETTIRTGEEIGIDDVLAEDRWLLFTRVSAATGIRSTLSLPLYRGPVVVGSVNIYGDVEGAFTGMEAGLAATFCAQVQAIIGNADLSTTPHPHRVTHDNAFRREEPHRSGPGCPRRQARRPRRERQATTCRRRRTSPHLQDRGGQRHRHEHVAVVTTMGRREGDEPACRPETVPA